MIFYLSSLLNTSSNLLILIVSAIFLSLNFLILNIILYFIDSISHISSRLNFQFLLNLDVFLIILRNICLCLPSSYYSVLILLRHYIGGDSYSDLEVFIFNLQLVMIIIHFWINSIKIIISQIFFLKHIRIIIHVIGITIFIFIFLFLVIFLVSLIVRIFDLLLLFFLSYVPWIILLIIFYVVIVEIFLRLFNDVITSFYYTSILNKFANCLSLVDLILNLPTFILLANR